MSARASIHERSATQHATVPTSPPVKAAPPIAAVSGDLGLLQHAHRLAISDPAEKRAQSILLNQFWTRLINNNQLEACYNRLHAAHSNAVASSQQKDRLIDMLRSQLAQTPSEKDIAKTMDRLSQMIVTLLSTPEGDDPEEKKKVATALSFHELEYSRLDRLTEFLQQELNRARNELNQANKRASDLQLQHEKALSERDRQIDQQAASIKRFEDMAPTTDTSACGSKRRRPRR